MPAIRLRFSIRTLLVVTALIAAACYWWIARPTILASRFHHAVQSQDFAAADRQISYSHNPFLADYQDRYTQFGPQFDIRWKIEMKPLTWRDIFGARRQMILSATYLEVMDRTHNWSVWQIDATPLGIIVHEPVVHGFSGA